MKNEPNEDIMLAVHRDNSITVKLKYVNCQKHILEANETSLVSLHWDIELII